MGYKFCIRHKTGASNKVADALLHREEAASPVAADFSLLVVISQPLPDILEFYVLTYILFRNW